MLPASSELTTSSASASGYVFRIVFTSAFPGSGALSAEVCSVMTRGRFFSRQTGAAIAATPRKCAWTMSGAPRSAHTRRSMARKHAPPTGSYAARSGLTGRLSMYTFSPSSTK